MEQLKLRDYAEPAFEISVAAADDRSDVKFFLDIGSFSGGSDVEKDLQLGGAETVVSTVSMEDRWSDNSVYAV